MRCPECGGIQYQNKDKRWCVRCGAMTQAEEKQPGPARDLRLKYESLKAVHAAVLEELDRKTTALREVYETGKENPGYGHTCSLIAREALNEAGDGLIVRASEDSNV